MTFVPSLQVCWWGRVPRVLLTGCGTLVLHGRVVLVHGKQASIRVTRPCKAPGEAGSMLAKAWWSLRANHGINVTRARTPWSPSISPPSFRLGAAHTAHLCTIAGIKFNSSSGNTRRNGFDENRSSSHASQRRTRVPYGSS